MFNACKIETRYFLNVLELLSFLLYESVLEFFFFFVLEITYCT